MPLAHRMIDPCKTCGGQMTREDRRDSLLIICQGCAVIIGTGKWARRELAGMVRRGNARVLNESLQVAGKPYFYAVGIRK